ncbi:MAG: hypothetical protein PF961_08405 [Planctomycetota bacterium]|nr:hypothetical protein [Planctomycetota bacterium]
MGHSTSRHPLWFLFALYFFHLMGTALNAQWGAFRYNLYILIGWAVTAATGMLSLVLPFGMEAGLVSSNAWILASIFLAFAWLWPNFQIMLFLIVPMKVKWLALLMWIGFGLTILFGDWTARLLALAALSNFFLFFGADIARRLRYGHRRMQSQLGEVRSAQEAFHRCHCCGITERDDTDRQFRVDTSTEGSPDICVPCLEQRKRAASDSQTDANA